jgi:hypothetical protein
MSYLGVKPPKHCQLGSEPITTEFIDGATKTGQWAYMCPKCHAAYGYGLGVGRGTKYVKQTDNQWKKVNK